MKRIIKDILVFVFYFLIVSTLFSMLLVLVVGIFTGGKSNTIEPFIEILGVIGMYVIMRWYAKRKEISLDFIGNDNVIKEHGKLILLIMSFGFFVSLVTGLVLQLIIMILPAFNDYVSSNITLNEGVFSIVCSFVAVCVLTPIVEEYIFRGILFNQMKKYGIFKAIIIVSLTFGIVHFNILASIQTFITSLVWCLVMWKYNDIRISIIDHAIFNTVNLAVSYLANNSTIDTIYTVFLFINAIFMVIYIFKNNKKIKEIYNDLKIS